MTQSQMTNQTCTEVAFSDPYTARLVKLRNILLSRPARVVPRPEGDPEANPDAEAARPARPTFAEMMAVVNRPRRHRA